MGTLRVVKQSWVLDNIAHRSWMLYCSGGCCTIIVGRLWVLYKL